MVNRIFWFGVGCLVFVSGLITIDIGQFLGAKYTRPVQLADGRYLIGAVEVLVGIYILYIAFKHKKS